MFSFDNMVIYALKLEALVHNDVQNILNQTSLAHLWAPKPSPSLDHL